MSVDPSLFSLPTVIWSGIVAAMISLGGVVLSNRASIDRLKEQLRHDAREKYRDRLAALRKDVYLKLIAETTRVNGYLGSLASKDPTASDFAGPLQDAIAELAKVQLIGFRETSAASAELSALYGEAMMRLVGTAKPMHEAKIDIKISDDLYQQSFAQAQRVLAEIATENESGAPNQDRLASLFQSLKIFQEQYSLQADERSDAWRRYNSMHRDLATAVLEEMKRLGPINIRLTCAIREEAGLDTDVSELKRRLEDGHKRASHAIDEVLRKFGEPEDG